MAEVRRQWSILKEMYKQCCERNEFYDDKELKQQCLTYLRSVDKSNCFKFLPFYDAQNQFRMTIQNRENANLCDLEFAMENLEKYALNLLRKPWCRDFCTIKV